MKDASRIFAPDPHPARADAGQLVGQPGPQLPGSIGVRWLAHLGPETHRQPPPVVGHARAAAKEDPEVADDQVLDELAGEPHSPSAAPLAGVRGCRQRDYRYVVAFGDVTQPRQRLGADQVVRGLEEQLRTGELRPKSDLMKLDPPPGLDDSRNPRRENRAQPSRVIRLGVKRV